MPREAELLDLLQKVNPKAIGRWTGEPHYLDCESPALNRPIRMTEKDWLDLQSLTVMMVKRIRDNG